MVMKRSFTKELFIVFKAITVVTAVILLFVGIGVLYSFEETVSDGECNVAVYPIEGVILPYHGLVDAPLVTTPDAVKEFLVQAENDSIVKAVLLEINSPGGTPVAAERIAESLRSSSLPIVGLIGDQGASGGYLAAAASDYLIASVMSDIGSIGVNMSYLEESQQLAEEGVEYVQLTAGAFKDAGTPYRDLTEEERALFQRDLDIVHAHFIDLVASYRNLEREAVVAVADGSTMTGSRAVEAGLIDATGGRREASEALAAILGIESTQVIYCEYELPIFPF